MVNSLGVISSFPIIAPSIISLGWNPATLKQTPHITTLPPSLLKLVTFATTSLMSKKWWGFFTPTCTPSILSRRVTIYPKLFRLVASDIAIEDLQGSLLVKWFTIGLAFLAMVFETSSCP